MVAALAGPSRGGHWHGSDRFPHCPSLRPAGSGPAIMARPGPGAWRRPRVRPSPDMGCMLGWVGAAARFPAPESQDARALGPTSVAKSCRSPTRRLDGAGTAVNFQASGTEGPRPSTGPVPALSPCRARGRGQAAPSPGPKGPKPGVLGCLAGPQAATAGAPPSRGRASPAGPGAATRARRTPGARSVLHELEAGRLIRVCSYKI